MYQRLMHKKHVLSIGIVSLISVMLLSVGFMATVNVTAQPGSMATLQNIPATYAVSIVPGAAQRDSPYHYFPPAIAIPTHSIVAWFNNDFGQPHTVTSGAPGGSNVGSMFNSGLMPATANSFFQYRFDKAGDFVYHCIIHPWRVAAVSVSDSLERGINFELTSGTGPVWNFSKDFRTLLNFEPRTVPLDRTTPLAYNITIYKNGTGPENRVFSDTFVTAGEQLPIELVRGGNETITYGPDFDTTGAYHIQGPIFTENANYTIRSEISAINGRPPEAPIKDDFSLQTIA
jgi:plastocyanin